MTICLIDLRMFPYENLEVYKRAYTTNHKVYTLLKNNISIPRYTKDQLGRASLSIMLNIAEGSGKFGEKDRRRFFITARGSAFECASLVTFLKDEAEFPEKLSKELYAAFEEISRMLYLMIKKLET